MLQRSSSNYKLIDNNNMETGRVLSMLNEKASKQLKNEQFDAAKRTVNEAIRYYEQSETACGKQDPILKCQAQVSALLKLKIGRLQAALGAQKNDDRLLASGKHIISQSSRTLRAILDAKNSKAAMVPTIKKQQSSSCSTSSNTDDPASVFSCCGRIAGITSHVPLAGSSSSSSSSSIVRPCLLESAYKRSVSDSDMSANAGDHLSVRTTTCSGLAGKPKDDDDDDDRNY